MNSFEKKYAIKEDAKITNFHKSRRMFCIYQNTLHIAKLGAPYSHAEWFEKEGWITRENDAPMDTITRGIVDSTGDVYFYSGYDFKVGDHDEAIFFSHLAELVEKLDLGSETNIFGGLIKQQGETKWPARKAYGTVKELLS